MRYPITVLHLAASRRTPPHPPPLQSLATHHVPFYSPLLAPRSLAYPWLLSVGCSLSSSSRALVPRPLGPPSAYGDARHPSRIHCDRVSDSPHPLRISSHHVCSPVEAARARPFQLTLVATPTVTPRHSQLLLIQPLLLGTPTVTPRHSNCY